MLFTAISSGPYGARRNPQPGIGCTARPEINPAPRYVTAGMVMDSAHPISCTTLCTSGHLFASRSAVCRVVGPSLPVFTLLNNPGVRPLGSGELALAAGMGVGCHLLCRSRRRYSVGIRTTAAPALYCDHSTTRALMEHIRLSLVETTRSRYLPTIGFGRASPRCSKRGNPRRTILLSTVLPAS